MQVPAGLYRIPGVVIASCNEGDCKECGDCLIKALDQYDWRVDLNRRTQHYGSRYDYSTKKLVNDVASMETNHVVRQFASYIEPYFKNLAEDPYLTVQQSIVNEYTSKQKISKHIDSPAFGPVVATLSLGSSMMMKMTRSGFSDYSITLNNGDFVILSGEARSKWTHELLPVNDKSFRRVSLTYRSINALEEKIQRRYLICGSRDFKDTQMMCRFLSVLKPPHELINGDADGADELAAQFCETVWINTLVAKYRPNWSKEGKAAGPLRNKRMIDEGKPNLILAFPSNPNEISKGTLNTLRQGTAAGIPCFYADGNEWIYFDDS